VGKTEGKVPLGILKLRWDNVIKMDFQEVGCSGMSWIEMTQVRERWRAFVNVGMSGGLYDSVIECVIKMELVILTKMCLNETCNRVCVGKHLFVVFPIRNSLKIGDVYCHCISSSL
jgi:hypothetical protein